MDKDGKDETVCVYCKKKLTDFDAEGKHNFCPTLDRDGKIIYVCIACKVNEV